MDQAGSMDQAWTIPEDSMDQAWTIPEDSVNRTETSSAHGAGGNSRACSSWARGARVYGARPIGALACWARVCGARPIGALARVNQTGTACPIWAVVLAWVDQTGTRSIDRPSLGPQPGRMWARKEAVKERWGGAGGKDHGAQSRWVNGGLGRDRSVVASGC